jgi:hypothetical protein
MKKTLLLCFYFFSIIFITNAQTNFADWENIGLANKPWKIASGDLDGDGIVDLAIAGYDTGAIDYIRWYQNDGNGNFSETSTSLVSSTIDDLDGLTIADIDGLHGNDIIATSASQDKLVYFPSNGLGGFGPEVPIGGSIDFAGQVVAGDINKDGNIDIALVAWGSVELVSWFSGDGAGGFTAETDIAIGGTDGSGPWTIDIADFDGDTDLDILVGYFSSGIEIYYNQYIETGSATFVKDAVSVYSVGFGYLVQTSFADVNNDGVMDVVSVDNSTGDVEWFSKIKNGASTAYTISDETIIDRPGAVAIADVDNDNIDDVIITDAGTLDNALIWFKGVLNDSPSVTPVLEADSNHQAYSITIDDFDNDGLNDIAYAGYSNSQGGVYWYENQTDLLSLNENELSSIKIHPNPTKNTLNFKVPFVQSYKISVYDILGKKVLNATLEGNNSLDVSQLNSGIYILKFDDYNTNFKFVKQ